jgi:uncharacterized membrane protein YfcA
MVIWQAFALFLGGIFAGFVNTLAGGGSIVSLSLMLLFGLDANVANGTNRLAIIFQSLTSSETFRVNKILDLKRGKAAVWSALIGSLAGAWVAVDLNKEIIEKIITIVMMLMLVFIFYNPSRWLKGDPERNSKPANLFEIFLFLVIGFYGGFVQVGIGYLLLAGLVLQAGYDLVKANALKVFITFVYSPFAFAIFVWHHQVSWIHGIPLAIGASLGAFIASKLAVRKGAGFIRWTIVVMIIITALQTFNVIDLATMFSFLKSK